MNPSAISSEFSQYGGYLMTALLAVACLAGLLGLANLFRKRAVFEAQAFFTLLSANVLFVMGFLGLCWLHYSIYQNLPLSLPDNLAQWLNSQLGAMNANAAYAMPLYQPASPPRYMLPMWIENEKYYFWFMCYSLLALTIWKRRIGHRLRGMLLVFLALQVGIIYFYADPFSTPLPRFFAEIAPWFNSQMAPMERLGYFMKLYPRLIFYYNASYMWLHPPMLFLSYACITVSFIACVFMLLKREPEIERLGYDCAKLGYFMLTLGMLLGYPWALKAWGPNWWWDPKICSSIMMWAIYSTYLHTRLYANKVAMWYFTSGLGILCFLAMIFTFITSFYFPGEHTFQ